MKILLIGHEGYLGSALVPYLKSQGHAVLGWGSKEGIENLTSNLLAKNKIEAVLNFSAAMTRSISRFQIHSLDEKVNVLGVRSLVEVVKGTSIPLIHLSTKDVYGNVYRKEDVDETASRYVPRFEISENQAFQPQTPYAKSKLMGEWMLESYPHANIIRLSSGYTDFFHRRGNWLMNFCQNSPKGAAATLSGTGKQLRDLLHVHDLGDLILKMLEKNKWGVTVNAGGGMVNANSILEIVRLIAPNAPCEFRGEGDFGFVTDNQKAFSLFGWKPQIEIRSRLALVQANILEQAVAS